VSTEPRPSEASEISDDAIARFVAGKCTPQEAERVSAWMAADPERRRYVDSLRRTWELSALPLQRWDTEQAWTELADQRANRRRGVQLPSISSSPPRTLLLRAAAAVVLVAGGALLWRVLPGTRGQATSQPPRYQEYATRAGQRAELRLPDGSRVMLSVDSRIRVPADFGAAGRQLTLDGEAFFDVQHDSAYPFRVSTARGVVEDLGTEFVVSAYPENRSIWVAVASGAVSLGPADTIAHPSAPVRLGRRDLGVLDSSRVEVRHDVDLEPYIGWTAGNLVFESVPLGVALPRIERWYDVEIDLADSSLANRHFTATLRDAPLEYVLDLLALSFNLQIERQGRSILLAPKPKAQRR
jgi:transmembrane sensor